MRVVILEDEKTAAENLKYLLTEIDQSIYVESVLDTVSGAVDYFSKDHDCELAFFDIHLADGNSFEIFDKVQINVPLIFTTAYDEYALKAFKVNSVDYLLKPIDEEELAEAIDKFKSSKHNYQLTDELRQILKNLNQPSKKFKSSFLVPFRDMLIPLDVNEIAYFTIDLGITKAITFDNKTYIIDEKMEDIEACLNPDQFFRANRQFIIQKRAIANLTIYFNGKLILNIEPKPAERIIISKAKAPILKSWIS